jgi:hypothetical protein
LNVGDVAYENQQLIPVEVVELSYDPQESENEERDARKAEVLEAVVWVICWIARFKRPAIALDVLSVATGLIFNPEQSSPAIAAKHHISLRAFTRLVVIAKKKLRPPRRPQVAGSYIIPAYRPKPATVNPVPYQAHRGVL